MQIILKPMFFIENPNVKDFFRIILKKINTEELSDYSSSYYSYSF